MVKTSLEKETRSIKELVVERSIVKSVNDPQTLDGLTLPGNGC